MRRRTFLATVGTASAAALAGCGDADEDPASNGSGADTGGRAAGDGAASTPDAATTPDDPATPDETTTPEDSPESESTAETATDEESTDEESSTEETTTTEEAADGERNSMEYPSDYVDVRNVEYDGNEGESTGPTVSGVVQNVSTEELSLVEAKVWAYDESDEEIGEALDDTTDLKPTETWEFACELWDTEAENVAYWKGRIDVSTY